MRRLIFAVCVLTTGRIAAQPPHIAVKVLQGDGALNDIRLRRARDPIIQVVNAAGQPVDGVSVTFLLPATGASGTFADSGLSFTTRTDTKGTATGRGLRPNRSAGQFRIRVTASASGAVATANITQTNVGVASNSGRSKKIALIAIIGGAAIGGAVAAAGHGGKSSAAAPSGGTTAGSSIGTVIVPGDPSLGPPH